MPSTIEFKQCTESDIDNLVAISQQFYPEHYTHIWKNEDPGYYINLSFTQSAFKEDLKNENIIYFLIQSADNVLGLLKIRQHHKVEGFNNSEALQLEKIYLLKASTGLGIGKKAIEFVKNYAFNLKKRVLWLDVMTTSPALIFYQRMGFQTITFYNLDYPGLKDEYREMQRMILSI